MSGVSGLTRAFYDVLSSFSIAGVRESEVFAISLGEGASRRSPNPIGCEGTLMALPCMSPRTAERKRYADLPGFLRVANAVFIAASSSPAFTASMTVWIVGTSLSLVPTSMAFWSLPSANTVLA